MSLPFHEDAADERDAALAYYRRIDPHLAEDLDAAIEERLALALKVQAASSRAHRIASTSVGTVFADFRTRS